MLDESKKDFDKLPLPDFSLVRYAKIRIYPVERIRGCDMNCEFCTVRGKPTRRSCSERLLESISFLVQARGATDYDKLVRLWAEQAVQGTISK